MKKSFALVLFLLPSVSFGASVSDLMTISHNSGFLDRIKYAMDTAAIAVMAEDPATASHNARVIYATQVLKGTASKEEYTVGVLTNSTIAAEANLGVSGYSIPDGDLQFTVNSMFNAFAGVSQ